MSILPRPGQLPYDFDEAQKQLQRTSQDLVSEQAIQLSNNILQRLNNARTQNNEQRVEQQNDIPFIIKTINDTITNDEDRKRLIRQTQVLSDALEDNSSTLKKYSKEVTHSLMNKGIGRDGNFTPLQNALVKAKDSVMSDLMPIFRLPLEGLGNFFKNRSDRNDRVHDEMLRQGDGGGNHTNVPAVRDGDSISSNFQQVGDSSNGGKQSIFNGPNYNVFNGPNYNVFNGGLLGSSSNNPITPRSPSGNVIEGDLRLLEYNPEDDSPLSPIPPKNPSDGEVTENSIRLLKDEFTDGGSPSPINPPNNTESKDFNTLEDEESYRRDSINEQRKTTEAIEKLSAVLTGKKNNGNGGDSSSGSGGGLSSLLDMGKDYLLDKLGIKKFKNTVSGLKDKAGDFLKKNANKAGDFLKNNASKAGDFLKNNANKAGNVAKELGSKSVSVAKEQAPRLGKFLVDKGSTVARSGANWVAANPALAAYGGLAVAAGVATKYANEKAKETEEGQKLLEYGDGVLETGDNFDLEDAGFEYTDISEKGLDVFGNINNEEKFVEQLQEKEKKAWDNANKDTEGFRTIASGYKDQKLAWEVWNRGGYEKKYNESKNSDLSTLQKNFAEDYKDAKFLDDSGVYFNRDKLAIVAMDSGGEKTFSAESNPGLKNVTKSIGMNAMGMPLQIESASNEYSNAKMSVSNANGNKKRFNVSATNGIEGYEKVKHEFGGGSSQIHDEKTVYGDSILFEDVSELKDSAPMQLKQLDTEKEGFHSSVLSSFLEGVKDYNIYAGLSAYEPYMFQVENAYLQQDESLRKTLIDKIKSNFLKSYENKLKEFNTTEDVTPKNSSTSILPNLSNIIDEDNDDYSQGSFEEVVALTESSNSSIPSIVQQHTTNGSTSLVPNKQNETEGVLTQQPSNTSKNIDAYTSQPTRTAVVTQEQQRSLANQKQEQSPTIINNNYNTTNNNVTQSSPQQKSPQIMINPSPSYLGQPLTR